MFVEHENHLICRDGSRRLIYWRNTALRDEAGHLQFVIGSGLDVTDLRRAEDASLEHLEEASRLQRVQTANELATLLAHELNQPLATIATYVEVGWQLLRKPSPDQDKLADNLERISQQAIRAGGIIRHLRSFISRARIDPAPMDLNQVVRSACNMMASQTRRSGIRLQQELDHRLPPALGADIHVEQVLLNLMRNAIEAIQGAGMEGGMVTIQTQRSGDMARVTVSDSGPGIDGELATLLFEPLSSRKPQGLGVGLRISRSLIETHKGRLWVEPKVPGGVFHFELPLAP
jgi:two-component system CheB/CheR fusion protein